MDFEYRTQYELQAKKLISLTDEDICQFNHEGYLVFEGLLDDARNERIKRDVDQLMEDRKDPNKPAIPMRYPELGLLTSEPAIVDRVAALMGGDQFVHHHIHATCHMPGEKGVAWHHDYEQLPQTNRSHLMVHVFMYHSGLNGEVGDLLVLPGSHKKIMNRDAFQQFGCADLPGSRTINNLAPASVVIVHSALQHARRAKPGNPESKRYFVDTSYCQYGIVWPTIRQFQQFNDMALELGWDRNGKYAFLYEEGHFFFKEDQESAFESKNQGSLAMQL